MKCTAIILTLVAFTSPAIAAHQAEPTFNYVITGCASTPTGMATQARGIQPGVEPTVAVEPGVVKYYRAAHHNCCRQVTIRKQMVGSMITLTEVWIGDRPCRCICFSEIHTTVSNLPPAQYDVTVYTTSTASNTNDLAEPTLLLHEMVTVPEEDGKPNQRLEATGETPAHRP